MKSKIHPTWYPQAKFICACGHSFTAGDTQEEVHLDICYKCHPFFTGEQRFVDVQGRVERFQSKQKAITTKPYVKKQDKKRLLRQQQEEAEKKQPKTLREMLIKVKN